MELLVEAARCYQSSQLDYVTNVAYSYIVFSLGYMRERVSECLNGDVTQETRDTACCILFRVGDPENQAIAHVRPLPAARVSVIALPRVIRCRFTSPRRLLPHSQTLSVVEGVWRGPPEGS
ncbi:hypothetical protein J6590_036643 [Homalodisca vitripennis]|nr:hypothetical protein J6590_036643 [Homalodisca vitripennis]